MSWTQHNSDILPAGTTATGKGGQPFSSSTEALLSHFDTSGQCEDVYGVYESPRKREEARLRREGRL